MGRSGTVLVVALAAVGSCVLPRCLALQKVEESHNAKTSSAPAMTKWLSWWSEGSKSRWLKLRDIQLASDATVIVTHAGKNNQEYIDHAVMLGVSLKRHVPDYPRIALGVRGMTDENQEVLEKAGWHVVLVADWTFSSEEGTPGCNSSKFCTDEQFILQQRDSMERINMFRLPVGRVLYLDADTYVASGELNALLNGTDTNVVPEGNIGMVPNACNAVNRVKTAHYSAGVMLFKPSLDKYKEMLVKVAETMTRNATNRKNDEQIINEAYENQATALDRKYNCMDPWDVQGADKCQQRCKEVVVSHFFGGPKPTIADETFLRIVRKPSGPFEKCSAMNHGSCSAWSNFYCDLVNNSWMLTTSLQQNIRRLGGCCHTPAEENDPDDCHSEQEDCAETVSFNSIFKMNRTVNIEKHAPWFGNYSKTAAVLLGNGTTNTDPLFHGGRPIYAGPNGYYLFYALESKAWVVEQNIRSARAKSGDELIRAWLPASYAFDYHMKTKCPEFVKAWKFPKPGFESLQNSKESTILVTNPNAAEAQTFESLAMYKWHMKYQRKREERYQRKMEQLAIRHRRSKRRRKANMEATQNNTTADETHAEDAAKTELYAKASEVTTADATMPQAAEAAPEQRLTDIKKKLEDSISALPDIPEVAAARKSLQMQLSEVAALLATKKRLEDRISQTPDTPETAAERKTLQKNLANLIARMESRSV